MNIFKFLRKDRKTLILIFVWTVTFIIIFVPFLRFQMIGSNCDIYIYSSLSAVCGLLLGPIYGFIAFTLGLSVYYFLSPNIFSFGVYSLIPPALATISAGMLSEGKWEYSAMILAVGLILFYLTDVGRAVFYYPCFSIFSLLIIIIFKEKIGKILFSNDFKKMLIGAIVLSFTSVMVEHLYGSILGILYLNLQVDDYVMAIPVLIRERVLMTAIGAFFIVLVLEICRCFLKNATKLREKLLREYIDEEIKISYETLKVDEELLKSIM